MAAATKSSVEEPGFITYLLDPELEHDCYFMVGNIELTVPIKIGAVKKMLLAHSMVLRIELQDSKLAEKGVVPIKDLYPETFKNLLKYIYGFDSIASLCFDDADDLFYAADKYMMTTLKDKLASRLMSLLSYENICGLMNNPACYQHLALDSAITQILQGETEKVLASPQFLNLSSDAFLKVLEQDAMSVPEIEIWRAALKWAKQTVDCEDGDVLRQKLKPHLKHIRLCTLNVEDLCQEVSQEQIISDEEIGLITKSVVLKKKQDKLTEICNTTVSRTIQHSLTGPTSYCRALENSGSLQVDLPFSNSGYKSTASFKLLTNKCNIKLLPFVFKANPPPTPLIPENATYKCEGTVEVSRITNYCNNTSSERSIFVRISQKVRYGTEFQVPITLRGKKLRLRPHNLYTFKVTFNENHMMYNNGTNSTISNGHFEIGFTADGSGCYYCPIKTVMYKTLT